MGDKYLSYPYYILWSRKQLFFVYALMNFNYTQIATILATVDGESGRGWKTLLWIT